MTPKEKAEQLVDKYDETLTYLESKSKARKCALIAVDEVILEQCKSSEKKDARYQDERIMFWIEVKQEIEKL